MRRAVVVAGFIGTASLLASCGGRPSASDQKRPTSTRQTQAAPAAPPSCPDAPKGKVLSKSLTSQATGGTERLRIYAPPGFEPAASPSVPLLVLLHGATADETQWLDVGAASAADCLIGSGEIKPMVIVAVDGGRVEGRGDGSPPAMERFVADELLPYLHKEYPSLGGRDVTSIGGISRGGGWALFIAADRPDLFSAAGGHSPSGRLTPKQEQSLATHDTRVWLDVGDDDSLRPSTFELAESLRSIGLGVRATTWPGGHDRLYWSDHVEDYLRFYARAW